MLKVIIADDEKLICRLVQTLADWQSLGMEVAGTAENGLEALDLIETLKPDILITDIRMPGCNGLELIEQAKKLRPELEVVIISGYAHFEYAQTAIRCGVGNYLLKPIKQAELMDTLKSIREKIEKTAGLLETEQNGRQAVTTLRNSLIRDLLSPHFEGVSEETLKNTYYIDQNAGVLQMLLIKIDSSEPKMSDSAVEMLQEKVRELLLSTLREDCAGVLFYFQMSTGYGLLQYREEKRAVVRKKIRDCLNQLNVRKDLYGLVEFSLSLGRPVKRAEELILSLKEAQAAIAERLVEGVGRILENVPGASGIELEAVLQQYDRLIGQAVELGDETLIDQAVGLLKEKAAATQKLCGREVLELVEKAGVLFITRIAVVSADDIRQQFEFKCGQCGRMDELFEELLKMQKQLLKEAGELKSSEATKPIRMAKQYVKQHFGEPITLEEVCEKAGFSVSYFSALFKKETGEGFLKYLTKVRIEEAKTLLRETDMAVSEICEQVGYLDRKHFTHTFRKATGLNPAEYRKVYG